MEWTMIDGAALYELIDPQLLLVVAACWVLGYMLKQTPRVPDWSIVYAVTGAALLFAVWLLGWSPASLLQGVLCGAAAVYGHQLVKQAKRATASQDNGEKRDV